MGRVENLTDRKISLSENFVISTPDNIKELKGIITFMLCLWLWSTKVNRKKFKLCETQKKIPVAMRLSTRLYSL